MKVAFIVRSLNNTGPILIVKSLVEHFINQQIQCKVFYFKDQVELDFLCPVKQIEFKNFDEELNEYDVIHSHNLFPDIYVWKYKKRILAKTVTTKHEYSFESFKYHYNLLVAMVITPIYDFVLNRFDVVVCLTNHMQQYYQKRLKTKVTYIYNGIKLDKNINAIDKNDIDIINTLKMDGKILIMTICILTKRKGIHQLIHALAKNDKLVLVVIGDGKERINLEMQAKKLGIIDRVFFLGYRFEALKYLQLTDLFALCSYSEGFPVAIMEAGVYSVSVVCSDIPILREPYHTDEVSFFELDNTASLLNAIENAYNNKVAMSSKLHHKVVSNYSLNMMGNQYITLYKQLIEGNQIV